jgi:hypothetical protein
MTSLALAGERAESQLHWLVVLSNASNTYARCDVTDEEFARFLYATAYDRPPVENLTIDDFSAPQMEIAQAVVVVRKIGENGIIGSGIERIKKKFPTNFKPGSDIMGKGTPGNKPKNPRENYEKALEVQKLINNGVSQKKACEQVGMSTRRFRDIRDELHKIDLGVIDFN